MKTQRSLRALVTVFALGTALFTAALPAQEPRLANLSTLTRVGTGADVLTVGFFVGGSAPKQVVIRGVGPQLASFGVTGALADPTLTVFGPNSSTTVAGTNDNWSSAHAAVFASVGAFALTPGSRDAAVVLTLAPGSYTAQVSGVGGASGVALVEVYEVGASGGKFLNLSTMSRVGGAAGTLTPGFVVSPGGGLRKLLIRAAGPALSTLNVPGAISDPTITLHRLGETTTEVASNDNWGTPVGNAAVSPATLSAAFTQAGAFAFPNNSRDAALLVDLPAGNYSVAVNGVGNATGLAVVEVYDLSPAEPTFVTLAATRAAADETGARNGEVMFTRSGPTTDALTIRYGIGGSAVNGVDYLELPGTITIPAGATSVRLPIQINPDLQNEGTDTVVVTIITAPGYVLGAQTSATVTITDSPATLYVANIRADPTAIGSTASGTATLLLSADNSLAAVTLSVSNLSSPVVSAHLRIHPSGDFVFNLPYQASGSAHWTFAPVGNYTSSALLEALRNGQIYVGIDTSAYPQGEVRGSFVQGAGSRVFVPHTPPPSNSLANLSAVEAARLLTQATFGPKKTEIDALTGGSAEAWIDAQLAMPFTSHRTAVQQDRQAFGGSPSVTNFNAIHPPNRQAAWWKTVLTAPDQLRQRVAFALSEIFVVSDVSLGDDSRTEPLANYYDILGRNAFGNYRTLLEEVTLSPMMGEYLSHLRNAKADPTRGTTPDENYAREIMQLFSIGLVQLQPDGTLVLGNDGLPIPTYDQRTIFELAKVFTGWAYPPRNNNVNEFRQAPRNYYSPMQLFPTFHDDSEKDIRPVLSTPIPAGQGGAADLRTALDALFYHQNTAPFIARRLIQRLVTSNPSPAYVYRVAQKFVDDGTGTRGNLAAVVRAILTDYEARSPIVAANPSFGKLKEPVLRLSAFLRAFDSKANSGRYSGHLVLLNGVPITGATTRSAGDPNPVTAVAPTDLRFPDRSIAQAALRSPTVFNFFSPDYVLPGRLAAAGLVAPEFEITDDTYATNTPNYFRNFVIANNTPVNNANPTQLAQANAALVPDYSYELSLLPPPPITSEQLSPLLDHLSLLLAAGGLTTEAKARIAAGVAALPANASALDRVRTAVLLVLTSPNAAVQN